jgi:hypothetical protein
MNDEEYELVLLVKSDQSRPRLKLCQMIRTQNCQTLHMEWSAMQNSRGSVIVDYPAY